MNAFDLQTPSRLAEWYIALAIGFTCAFVAFVLLDKITPPALPQQKCYQMG